MIDELPCRRVAAIDTGHSPFYSAPEALAGLMIEIATEATGTLPASASEAAVA
jgi:hypothetical protein